MTEDPVLAVQTVRDESARTMMRQEKLGQMRMSRATRDMSVRMRMWEDESGRRGMRRAVRAK